jgi:hypothetical protein
LQRGWMALGGIQIMGFELNAQQIHTADNDAKTLSRLAQPGHSPQELGGGLQQEYQKLLQENNLQQWKADPNPDDAQANLAKARQITEAEMVREAAAISKLAGPQGLHPTVGMENGNLVAKINDPNHHFWVSAESTWELFKSACPQGGTTSVESKVYINDRNNMVKDPLHAPMESYPNQK